MSEPKPIRDCQHSRTTEATMTTNEPSVLRPSAPSYFRSFVSYEIPFRPDEPVHFADTEGLRSFYAAWRDPAGRVIRFDKVRLVRAENAAPRPFELPAAEPPARRRGLFQGRPRPGNNSFLVLVSGSITRIRNPSTSSSPRRPIRLGGVARRPCSGKKPPSRTGMSIGRTAICDSGR